MRWPRGPRPLAVRGPLRVRQAEKVEVEVTLSLVEPVVAALVLLVDLAEWLEGGDLAGDGFPLADSEG